MRAFFYMAGIEGDFSNQLVSVFEEWNKLLKDVPIDDLTSDISPELPSP